MENRNNVITIDREALESNRLRRGFNYPHQVVMDPNIKATEKRAILSAWASDKHAVKSFPTLRHLPGTPFPVTFSSIMDALASLDRFANPRETGSRRRLPSVRIPRKIMSRGTARKILSSSRWIAGADFKQPAGAMLSTPNDMHRGIPSLVQCCRGRELSFRSYEDR